jgi:hypothetical protein
MKTIIQKTILLILIGGTITSCGCLKKCDEPAGTISVAKAKTMQADYLSHQHQYINTMLDSIYPGTGKDNREIWFSIEEIEQYICYAKKESLKKGVTLSGLRVYLAAKRIPNPTTTDPDEFLPRTTVFFVPTHKVDNPNNRSISTDEENNGANNKDTKDIKPKDMGDVGNGTYQ